jgi:hypothetical protein
MARNPDQNEWRAANLIAMLLEGTAEPRDVEGAPDATHDFDIVSAERTVALEITVAEDGEVISLLRAANPQTDYNVLGLTRDWWIAVPMGANVRVKQIAKKAPRLLAVLEQHNVDGIGGSHGTPPGGQAVEDAAARLLALGMTRATALREATEAKLLFSTHGGIVGDRDLLNDLAVHHAEQNAAKLRAASADERHLCIVVPPSQANAELAMATLPPPSGGPSLPEGVDLVWLVNWHERKIWRAPRGARWEVLDVPS